MNIRIRITQLAIPNCQECHGDGIIVVCYNGDPDKVFEEQCWCVERDGRDPQLEELRDWLRHGPD